jgi:hypothetical protein
MSSGWEYLPVHEIRRRLQSSLLTRNRVENAIRNRQIRTIRSRRRGGRRIHVGDTRAYLAKVREALRSGRTTTEPWNDNGVIKLPVGLLLEPGLYSKGGYRRDLIGRWCHDGCCHLLRGRKLRGKRYLAMGRRGDVDSLVPTLFVWATDWRKVEKSIEAKANAIKIGAAPVTKQKKWKIPNARTWQRPKRR